MSEKKLSKSSSNTKSTDSIESSLARLETIVTDIESNPPPLEILIERYEEGVNLLKICQQKLTAAEKKIELITRNTEGKSLLEPFND